jgi:hypothetical protein
MNAVKPASGAAAAGDANVHEIAATASAGAIFARSVSADPPSLGSRELWRA